MSARRLAEDHVQPEGFAFSRANAAWAKQKIKDYPKGRQASAVIPLLMRAQEQEGWVTKAAIEHVADMLDMPLIRVLEVATFYTQFQLAPVGKRAHIQVCGTTPCMLRGAGELMDICKKQIAPKPFELSEDGNMSWEEVECQGACVNAPMIMIFKDSYEDLSPRQMEHIVDRFAAGKGHEITPGPQIDRHFSAPEGGPTSLLEDPVVKKRVSVKRSKSVSSGEKQMPATNAARPASHVDPAAPAIKTPVGRAKSSEVVDEKKAKRAAAGSKSPQARAKAMADDVKAAKGTEAEVQPAELRQPKPEDMKAGGPKKSGSTRASGKGKAVAGGTTAAKAKASSSKKTAETAGFMGTAKGSQPGGIAKPSQVDDLKLISGVGPKIEGILNGLGIWKFEQIAKWKKAERKWVDGHLRFHGRIERDEWVKQAEALAKGGRDEYVRVFGKEPR
ncbi:MAG: NADH-quinone oxidoreductase subunit E [Pseudomonadota bacterium]